MDAEWDACKKELSEELGYRTIGWDTTISRSTTSTDTLVRKKK